MYGIPKSCQVSQTTNIVSHSQLPARVPQILNPNSEHTTLKLAFLCSVARASRYNLCK